MRKTSRIVAVFVAPMSIAALTLTVWFAWARLEGASLAKAEQGIVRAVSIYYGHGPGAWLLRCPAPLATALVVSLLSAPLMAALYGCYSVGPLQRISSRAGRAGMIGFIVGIFGLPYFVVAAGTLGGLQMHYTFNEVMRWCFSLWLCTALFGAPFFALGAAVAMTKLPNMIKPLLVILVVGAFALARIALHAIHAPLERFAPNALDIMLLDFDKSIFLLGAISSLAWTAGICGLAFVIGLHAGIGSSRGRWASFKGTQLRLGAVFGVFFFLSPTSARAYGKEGHLGITESAWQVMRAASATNTTGPSVALKTTGCTNSSSLCGEAVSQSQWNGFLTELDKARRVIGAQKGDIPNGTWSNPTTGGQSVGDACFSGDESTQVAMFPEKLTAQHFWRGDSNNEPGDCGLLPGTAVQGMYESITVPRDGTGNQGSVLGWHSKHRDDDLGESTVSLGIPGTQLLDQASDGYELILGAVLVPFVCAYLALFGDDDNCDARARAFADDLDPFDVLKGFIPGIGLPQAENYIGFWHHINVRDRNELMNKYNDRQGFSPSWAGPEGIEGASDQALTIGSDILYLTLVPQDSTGDDRYEIKTSSDGHQATRDRDDWAWHSETIGDTEFSPLDNLAYYGYNNTSYAPIKRLGWPLHAIGDATVPQHVVATAGHGHAPYETWVDTNFPFLTKQRCEDWSTSCTESSLVQEQSAQAKRVLQVAYRWRQYLRTHGVRDFITALALDTLNNIGGDHETAWPFCDVCSSFYAINEGGFTGEALQVLAPEVNIEQGFQPEDLQENPTIYYDDKREQAQKLIESAMGAKIGFLVFAAQDLLGQCIPRNGFGCMTNTDCCNAEDTCSANGICLEPGPI